MRRTILSLSVFALVLGSCDSDTDEGQDAEPTGSPETTPSVTAATASPTASPTPELRLGYDFPPWDEAVELIDHDTAEPLEYQVLGRQRQQGGTLYDVEYRSSGYAVPAYLVVPEGDGPFPVVLYAHCGGCTRSWFLDDSLAFARDGYAGLLITGPYTREPYLPDSIIYDAPLEVEAVMQYAKDLRRGLDLLETLPEIDASRIGFVGFSAGSWPGTYLAATEDRIDAYVLMSVNGWPCTRSGGGGASCDVLDLYGYPTPLPPQPELEAYLADSMAINAAAWAAHGLGSALLFQASKTDEYESVPTIRAVFDAAPEPKSLRWYEGGHALGCGGDSCEDVAAYADHRAWLQDHV